MILIDSNPGVQNASLACNRVSTETSTSSVMTITIFLYYPALLLQDDLLNANTRLCYAEKWLFARFESFELKHDKPPVPKPRTDHEDRVHVELLRAYELQIKVTLFYLRNNDLSKLFVP